MNKIVLIGSHSNEKLANSLLNKFEIIAGVVDTKALNCDKQKEWLYKNNIKEVSFECAMNLNPDIYLILVYNHLIDKKYIKPKKILNLHGGILPKYRGFSSNLIAILNNEKKIGYTLHIVDEGMDSGDILATFEVKNDTNLMAEELISKIIDKVAEKLPQTIQQYIDGKLNQLSQYNATHIYSTRLRASDGEIRDWNLNSLHIYNLYIIFGGKNGSGIFFYHRGQRYRITKMSMCSNLDSYTAISGVVVFIKNDSFWVKTKDTCISIDEITLNGEVVLNLVKIGTRLGN